jgi:hypothetical protein
MKRLVVLLVAMLVAAGLWAQAAAPAAPAYPQWVWNGNFNYGVLSNFSDEPMQFADVRTIWKINLDANNFVQMRLRFKDADFNPWVASETLQAGIRADQAFVQSNLTGAFGVTGPAAASVMYGFVNTQFSDITGGISPFEVSDLSGNDIGDRYQPIIAPWVTFNNMVTIKAIVAPNVYRGAVLPGPPVTGFVNRYNQGYEVAAYGTFAPIAAEVGYGHILPGGANNGDAADDIMWVGANFKQTSGDISFAVAANAQFAFSDGTGFQLRNHYALASNDLTDDTTYGYGVAAMVNYMKGMVIAKAGLVGLEGSMVNRAEVQLIVQPIPQVAFDIGAVLNLDTDYLRYFGAAGGTATTVSTDVEMLNDLDIAMILYAGKVPFRIGYLLKDKNAPYSVQADDIGRVGDANHAGTVEEGGAYISVILAY